MVFNLQWDMPERESGKINQVIKTFPKLVLISAITPPGHSSVAIVVP